MFLINLSSIFIALSTVLYFQSPVAESDQNQDHEGVKIGNQIWTTQNLEVTKFRNGDPIDQVNSIDEWKEYLENEKPAWCYFDFDSEYGKKYGKMYNRYAVEDSRGLAPEGWHIPSKEEWEQLAGFLEDKHGGKVGKKSENTGIWEHSENKPSFSGVTGGNLNFQSIVGFQNKGKYALWWGVNKKEDGSKNLTHVFVSGNFGSFKAINYDDRNGNYVRCIKN